MEPLLTAVTQDLLHIWVLRAATRALFLPLFDWRIKLNYPISNSLCTPTEKYGDLHPFFEVVKLIEGQNITVTVNRFGRHRVVDVSQEQFLFGHKFIIPEYCVRFSQLPGHVNEGAVRNEVVVLVQHVIVILAIVDRVNLL